MDNINGHGNDDWPEIRAEQPSNDAQKELRERIGALKPHTETQLPLKDLLSYLELNALIEVVNQEVRAVLDSIQNASSDTRHNALPIITEYKKQHNIERPIAEVGALRVGLDKIDAVIAAERGKYSE